MLGFKLNLNIPGRRSLLLLFEKEENISNLSRSEKSRTYHSLFLFSSFQLSELAVIVQCLIDLVQLLT